MLTGAGRRLSLTQRTARKLRRADVDVFELDVTVPEHGRRRARRGRRQVGPRRRRAARDRLRARVVPRRRLHRRTVGRRRRRDAHLDVLAQDARRRVRAADGPGRLVRRPRLRQPAGVAGVQLDGRRQVGAAEPSAATWPRSSGRRASAATWSPPARSRRWRRSRSPASSCSRTCGTTGRRSVGTSPTRRRSPRPAWRCCQRLVPATTGEIVHVDGGYHAIGV